MAVYYYWESDAHLGHAGERLAERLDPILDEGLD
jgi:hypothetical protein